MPKSKIYRLTLISTIILCLCNVRKRLSLLDLPLERKLGSCVQHSHLLDFHQSLTLFEDFYIYSSLSLPVFSINKDYKCITHISQANKYSIFRIFNITDNYIFLRILKCEASLTCCVYNKKNLAFILPH
jgi:hypothetical protein